MIHWWTSQPSLERHPGRISPTWKWQEQDKHHRTTANNLSQFKMICFQGWEQTSSNMKMNLLFQLLAFQFLYVSIWEQSLSLPRTILCLQQPLHFQYNCTDHRPTPYFQCSCRDQRQPPHFQHCCTFQDFLIHLQGPRNRTNPRVSKNFQSSLRGGEKMPWQQVVHVFQPNKKHNTALKNNNKNNNYKITKYCEQSNQCPVSA